MTTADILFLRYCIEHYLDLFQCASVLFLQITANFLAVVVVGIARGGGGGGGVLERLADDERAMGAEWWRSRDRVVIGSSGEKGAVVKREQW